MKRRWLFSLLFLFGVIVSIWTTAPVLGALHENYKVKTFWTVLVVLVVGSGLDLGSYLPSRRARRRMVDRAWAKVEADYAGSRTREDALGEGVVVHRLGQEPFAQAQAALEAGKYVIFEDEGEHEPTTEPPTERQA